MTGPDDEAVLASVAALASLASMSPRRLRLMLAHHPPVELWLRIRDGRSLAPGATDRMRPTTLPELTAQAAGVEPSQLLDVCRAVGARVLLRGDPDFPALLDHDPEPPPVVFVRGDPAAIELRRVGIVGTRNATAAGRATAHELGEGLAMLGITVVSGLARGIDAAAHQGVRAAGGRPVAVVGSGIDVPYPRSNRDLWEWVATDGLLVSQWPPGVQADAWHFPVRNRVVAALSEVLVVVESRESGGSLITAAEAARRGITVMAVPGSLHCRAARGTNALLSEACAVLLTSVDDVVMALGLDTGRAAGDVPLDRRPSPGPAGVPPISGGGDHTLEAQVFALCADRPCTLDDLVVALGAPISAVALAVARLERDDWVTDTAGWIEPAGSKLRWP